jgi:shikimate kinase
VEALATNSEFTAIALIGLPGSGKSTIGRHVARRLQQPFVDADRVIEDRLGCSIREYFEREGEAAFRDVEQQVIDELTLLPGRVIATGGGAVLRESNRNRLHGRTTVVYLNATPEALLRRVSHDVRRPLLLGGDPLTRLRDLHKARDPLYREIAHLILDTGRPSVPSLVNAVLTELHRIGAARAA